MQQAQLDWCVHQTGNGHKDEINFARSSLRTRLRRCVRAGRQFTGRRPRFEGYRRSRHEERRNGHDEQQLQPFIQGRQHAGRGDRRRRGQEGRCYFSRRNHEEVTFGRERFLIGKIMQSCFQIRGNLSGSGAIFPPRGAGACFLVDRWLIPRPALLASRIIYCHRLMTYALIASKTATLTAIMIKKNFPIAPPFAGHNARQQE